MLFKSQEPHRRTRTAELTIAFVTAMKILIDVSDNVKSQRWMEELVTYWPFLVTYSNTPSTPWNWQNNLSSTPVTKMKLNRTFARYLT